MLKNDCREVMLKNGFGECALVVDGLLYAHVDAGSWVTIKDVQGYLPEASLYLIRKALNNVVVFRKRSVKSTKKGRPTTFYRLPYPDVLRHMFVADWVRDVSDDLPFSAFSSIKQYRMCLHFAYLERRGRRNVGGEGYTQESVGHLAGRLGVDKATIRNYNRELGIAVRPQFDVKKVKHGDLNKLGKRLNDDGSLSRSKWLVAGNPLRDGWDWQLLQSNIKQLPSAPPVKPVAFMWLKQKRDVYLVEQLANCYATHGELYYA